MQMIFTRQNGKQKTGSITSQKGQTLDKVDSRSLTQALISAGFTGTNSIAFGQIVCGYQSPNMMSSVATGKELLSARMV